MRCAVSAEYSAHYEGLRKNFWGKFFIRGAEGLGYLNFLLREGRRVRGLVAATLDYNLYATVS